MIILKEKDAYIIALLSLSEVRDFERGPRRYFPLPMDNCKGDNWLYLAYYVLYGYLPTEQDLVWACADNGLRDYVEEIDGQLWVRTVYAVDYPDKNKGHKLRTN